MDISAQMIFLLMVHDQQITEVLNLRAYEDRK
jgi:hypothetical protein